MPTFTESTQNTGVRRRIPLHDIFQEAFPEAAPVYNLISKKRGRTTSPINSEIEWMWKTFAPPSRNPVLDNVDVQDSENRSNEAYKKVLKGRIELARIGVKTGRIAQATVQQHGGVNDIHKDHIKDALRELREIKELIIMSDSDSQEQNEAVNPKKPYMTRGLPSWCAQVAHADLPIPVEARMPAGNQVSVANAGAYTEEHLKAQFQSCWDTRRRKANWKLLCNSALQTAMDNWLSFGPVTAATMPIRRLNGDVSDNTWGTSIRSYNGSFGTCDMLPVHQIPPTVLGVLADFDYLELVYIDEVGWKELPDLGGGPRGYADCLFGLVNLNPQAHGIIRKA